MINGYESDQLVTLRNKVNTTWENSKEEYMAIGWREIEEGIKAPAGEVVTGYDYVQDANDDSKVIRNEVSTTQEAIDAANEAAVAQVEADRIANKSDELKAAENSFISKVLETNSALSIDIGLTDGFVEIMTKVNDSEAADIDKLKKSMELQALWNEVLFHGGRFGDVQYHE